jgi:hypothetical protein
MSGEDGVELKVVVAQRASAAWNSQPYCKIKPTELHITHLTTFSSWKHHDEANKYYKFGPI